MWTHKEKEKEKKKVGEEKKNFLSKNWQKEKIGKPSLLSLMDDR